MSTDIAWITGASSGIGRALALRLAETGSTVAASARNAAALKALAAEPKAAARIHPYPLDVTRPEDVTRVHAAIRKDLGPVTLAVLNAGTHIPMDVEDFSAVTARTLMEINYMGTVHCLEALLPAMTEQGKGRIAVVASVAGYRGLPTAAAYGPTKAALNTLCEALAPGLARRGVRVQVVNPGFVRTPLTDRNTFPMPFLMEAEDAARILSEGLRGTRFEIAFPWPLVRILKLARCLPHGLYFKLVQRVTGS